MRVSKFNITDHAWVRVKERGLRIQDVEDVVKYADGQQQIGRGTHGGTTYRFHKAVDGDTLVVVAEVKGKECWVITGFVP